VCGRPACDHHAARDVLLAGDPLAIAIFGDAIAAVVVAHHPFERPRPGNDRGTRHICLDCIRALVAFLTITRTDQAPPVEPQA
jgi:hypothetical protein